MNFRYLIEKQRDFFNEGHTKEFEFRMSMLQKLRSAIKSNEGLFYDAMKRDMNKCPTEVYMTETGMVLEEISFHLRHLSKWMKDKKVTTPIAQFP